MKDLNNRRNCWGQGAVWKETLYFPLNFCINALRNNKSITFEKRDDTHYYKQNELK